MRVDTRKELLISYVLLGALVLSVATITYVYSDRTSSFNMQIDNNLHQNINVQ